MSTYSDEMAKRGFKVGTYQAPKMEVAKRSGGLQWGVDDPRRKQLEEQQAKKQPPGFRTGRPQMNVGQPLEIGAMPGLEAMAAGGVDKRMDEIEGPFGGGLPVEQPGLTAPTLGAGNMNMPALDTPDLDEEFSGARKNFESTGASGLFEGEGAPYNKFVRPQLESRLDIRHLESDMARMPFKEASALKRERQDDRFSPGRFSFQPEGEYWW